MRERREEWIFGIFTFLITGMGRKVDSKVKFHNVLIFIRCSVGVYASVLHPQWPPAQYEKCSRVIEVTTDHVERVSG